MPDNKSIEYINSTDYKVLEDKIKQLGDSLDDLTLKSNSSRKLRFAEVDVESERKTGRLQPDEMYIPQHIIDTNIRREQSSYVQYITQSPRAVVLSDLDDDSFDLALLEKDLTKKLRFDGWQLSMFSNIDGFQANGYSMMEVVLDLNNPGELGHEYIQYGDFSFISDTRDIQAVEMTGRKVYFTKTRLLAMCGDPLKPDLENDWEREQVTKIVESDPSTTVTTNTTSPKDSSLYGVIKTMFRVGGIVQVGWTSPMLCDGWLRKPRPLYLGRKKIAAQPTQAQQLLSQPQGQPAQPQFENDYETEYPYNLYPYLISENDTISELKGRVFLDQDVQEAVSSLLSSTCTQARRAAGLYFSKDVADPNDDLLLQKNVYFRSGCIVNSKITSMQLPAPDSSMFGAINALRGANENETSQVNFAVANRKDSRKTAKEITVAEQQSTTLSTVQVVLFSLGLKGMYMKMTSIIRSRVLAGLIKVSPNLMPLYQRRFSVKPSGDTDVIEKQQLVQAMMTAWPVMQNTPCAQQFLSDMLELMFPNNAAKYLQAFQQAQQQQQSQQAQQQQQVMQMLQQTAGGIIKLADHPEFFSDAGRLHAYPIVENAADKFKEMEKQMKS